MPGILEIPEVRQRLSRLWVEEYHGLDEYNERRKRTELIGGIACVERILGVNSHGEPLSELVTNLRSALKEALDFKREEVQ